MGPGAASAATVECIGSTEFTDEIPATPRGLAYSFLWNEDILAYSIFSTRELGYFSPEVTPFLQSGEGSGELVQCEGQIPSYGFGCRGKVANDHIVRGLVATSGPPCPREGKGVRLWLVVTTVQGTNTYSSRPFRLRGPNCSKPAPGSKR